MVKLLVSVAILAALLMTCFLDIDTNLRGVIIGLIGVLAFPITLLLGIDASRTIKRVKPAQATARIAGVVLGFPLAIMGTILLGFSIVYPIFGVRELWKALSGGGEPILPLIRLFIAAMSFVVGLHYVREGFGRDQDR